MRATFLALAIVWTGCGPGMAESPDGDNTTGPLTEAQDRDGDGVADESDNCVDAANPDQEDIDINGLGDACDDPPDLDEDGVLDHLDNCPSVANAPQADDDDDRVGNACDNCPEAVNTDQADGDGDGVGDACPCDTCVDGQWCVQHPDKPLACSDACAPERQGADGVCCPVGARWDDETGTCPFSDLTVDADRLLASVTIIEQDFLEGDCAILEGCIPEPGVRRLLRFDTVTPNTGPGDIFMGDPAELPDVYVYSECHDHNHLDGYADYSVVDALGTQVGFGHKQAFCLLDWEKWDPKAGPSLYTCGHQGISSGWADTYARNLDCQFVDITDVKPGTYTLRVEVNVDHLIPELDYANNTTEVEVVIP